MAKSNVEQLQLPYDKVWASPTKKFFVEMLTRDIDLMDAIMDLVDNCIDGVHRQRKLAKVNNIYKGYYADITLTEEEFTIHDNCGGIPENVAKHYAFKMGREDAYKDDLNLETVGVYGIGMKRAIFKMGLEATIISHHEDDIFQVSIPKNWSSIEGWFFDFQKLERNKIPKFLKTPGTFLKICHLHKAISTRFNDKSGFEKDLRERLKQHYGYIIQQGFTIKLNGFNISSLQLNILSAEPANGLKKSIKPYVYSTAFDGVSVEVIIGFYRPPAEMEEIEKELEGSYAKSSSENAGITVLCNDRVVLFANKDYLTGWGDNPVPNYHTQFINIAGVVHFRSNEPIKLPITTTKRGLDTSSIIYNSTKQKIKEGLKLFTSFTNHWKAPSEERTSLFRGAKKINALVPGQTKSNQFQLTNAKRGDEGKYQVPDLPRPDDAKRDLFVSISFSREKTKVEEFRNYYFEGETKSATEIGGWCFDELYSQIP